MTNKYSHSLAKHRDFALYKMITDQNFSFSDFSRVIYQDNSFSKEEYQMALDDGLLDDIEGMKKRASEKFDAVTLMEIYEAFYVFAALIESDNWTQEHFEDMFFSADHILKH